MDEAWAGLRDSGIRCRGPFAQHEEIYVYIHIYIYDPAIRTERERGHENIGIGEKRPCTRKIGYAYIRVCRFKHVKKPL